MYRIPILSLQLVRERTQPSPVRIITSPCDAYQLLREWLEPRDRECFALVLMDTRKKVLGLHLVSIGSLNASLVHPREVFKSCLLANCAAIILAHNHPSGDPEPSQEDLAMTARLLQAGEILGARARPPHPRRDGVRQFERARHADHMTTPHSLALWDDAAVPTGSRARQTVFVGNLSRYPDAVARGMHRLLAQFDFAGQPAFACGRRLYAPAGSLVIDQHGHPRGVTGPLPDFHARALEAVVRMETRDTYSFNRHGLGVLHRPILADRVPQRRHRRLTRCPPRPRRTTAPMTRSTGD